MDRSELINYLINEDVISEHQAHEMDNFSLFVKAVEYNGIRGFDHDIKEWIEPYFQEYFSKHLEELNIKPSWIQDKYNQFLEKGLINESEPSPTYPNDIFLP